MLAAFFFCATALLGWRLVTIMVSFVSVGANEMGFGSPPEILGTQVDQSALLDGGPFGIRPVSVLVPFSKKDPPQDLAATLNALSRVEIPKLEILVLTDLDNPRRLPLQGFEYEFVLRKTVPVYERRIAAPAIRWEAVAPHEPRLRLLGLDQTVMPGNLDSKVPWSRTAWRVAALNAGLNAARFPMVVWNAPGLECEPRTLARLGKAMLAREDIGGVFALTLHRKDPRSDSRSSGLALAVANVLAIRRFRLAASWLAGLAQPEDGIAMWRRGALVEGGGFVRAQSRALALLRNPAPPQSGVEATRVAAAGTGRARAFPVFSAQGWISGSRRLRDVWRDESRLRARRTGWVKEIEKGSRWRWLATLAADRLALLLEAAVPLLGLGLFGTALLSGVPENVTALIPLVLAVSLGLLIVLPTLDDWFVLLADQLRYSRWAGGTLVLLLAVSLLRNTLWRPVFAVWFWPSLLVRSVADLRRGARRAEHSEVLDAAAE